MTAMINGSSTWSAVRVVANDLSGSLSSLEVTGSDCNNRLWILIDPAHGLGSYSVEDSVTATFNRDPGPNDWTANRFQGGSGSVTLTALKASGFISVSVSGTFEFTLVRLGSIETMVIRGSFDTRASP